MEDAVTSQITNSKLHFFCLHYLLNGRNGKKDIEVEMGEVKCDKIIRNYKKI